MNIQLVSVTGDISGATGLAILSVFRSRKLSVGFLESRRAGAAGHYGAAMEFTADLLVSLRPEGLTTTV
jgi:hypothetical protein